ncbi:hypothetical protein B0T10DRAFT_53145 [Thelonectria olida]|uniref:Zn(2)-C6 fungal-type domain-containing protein n=1 Tax=Thelonectria olida TaxID=1576542 RepID=A0A9P8VMB0_9HYPO|nr:hypothetical protein B0T10DRAFT_53145 [Thelonectria olida]
MADAAETDAPRRQRRDKYIAKACQACRRRKIKCSGHDICLNCVDRGTECIYDSERRKRGQRAGRRRLDDAR